MAAFGTPIPHDDDEDRAVRCAIHMIQDLWKWNQERRTTGVKPLDMGVGINTDMIVSGNIGSPKRMNYTLIGDGVNLASRLESACKQYRARILISEYTVKKLKGTYRMREIDKVIVKGKTEPVSVFEVLDYHTDATFPNLPDTLSAFKNGLEEYRNRRWDKAIKSFSEARSHNPGDHLSELYIGRSNLMKSSPPPKDWDGTWVMTAK